MGNIRKTRLTLAAFMVCTLYHFAHPVHATMERDGATWWSVEELIEVQKEAKAEREAMCGEPPNSCYAEQFFRMVGQEPRYKALENLLAKQLSVTSINPAEGTVKVFYYQNTNSSLINGIEDNRVIERYYLGWDEYDQNQIFRRDFEVLLSSSTTGNHVVYYGDTLTEGENWIPNLKETTLRVDSANLMKNTSGVLNTKVYGGYVASGNVDYSECLNSPDYQEGMECKLYSSNNGAMRYFPNTGPVKKRSIPEETSTVELTNPDENVASHEDETEDQPRTATNSNLETDNQPVLSNDSGVAADSQLESPINLASKVNIQVKTTPKAPETGGNNNVAKYNPELIIWFVTLMIFGILLVIWWFIPTRAEKSRKKYKKCKKSIDKSSNLR